MRMQRVRMQPLDDDGEPAGEPFDATVRWETDTFTIRSNELPVIKLHGASVVMPMTRSAVGMVMGMDDSVELITDDDDHVVGWRMK